MKRNQLRLTPRGVSAHAIVIVVMLGILAATPAARAITVFNGATGGISFGVANIAPPVSPGVPTYLANNFNLRNDILTNPGIGSTAYPVVANNTSTTGFVAWGPGQFLYNIQNGGGNINGPFGSGAAAITGPRFAYRLADGGIPGGVSTSYEIMTWDASFTQVGGAPVGTIGTFITMGGTLPLVQDLAMVSLRTQLIGNTIGVVEVPGLILAVERTGPATIFGQVLQDNLGGGATPMPGGWAIIANGVTGQFRALAYNVFPDLGALDLQSIPNGEVFTARVTATVYADPASIEMFDPLAVEHADLLAAALNSSGQPVPFPVDTMFDYDDINTLPEPSTLALTLVCLLALRPRRR